MHILSDKLFSDDYHNIARAMTDVVLYDCTDCGKRIRGTHAGKTDHSVTLRPTGDTYRLARPDSYTKTGLRRIWAVSWAGHYVFMRAALLADPNATIISHMPYVGSDTTRYYGLLDFDAYAYGTGAINVGSMAIPALYWSCQAPGHVLWEDEHDLQELSQAVAESAGLVAVKCA